MVIGEGERDEAPMLYIGEKVGSAIGKGPKIDIALDPLEGTTITAKAGPNALAVLAIADEGGRHDAPKLYIGEKAGAAGGPGRMIRTARERASMSIEELAVQTRLARPTLEALESDDFSTLHEAVYVRGYYRKCAKVLKLPEAELIGAYDKLLGPKAPPLPTKLLLVEPEPVAPPYVAPADWDGLAAAVASCTRCKLCKTRTKTVFGVGPQDAS
eukprot:gene66911-91629_t